MKNKILIWIAMLAMLISVVSYYKDILDGGTVTFTMFGVWILIISYLLLTFALYKEGLFKRG